MCSVFHILCDTQGLNLVSESRFSGVNGSGKTHTCLQLLRQLFDMAGGGPETDAFKHLRATFTVLRSMGSAATASNPESTRMVSPLVFVQDF